MCGSVGRRRGETVDLDAAVIAGSREVLIGWVERDAFDVTLVVGERFELFESAAGPDYDFAVQANRDEDGGIVGPAEVLDVVVVAYQSPEDAPVLYGRCLLTAKRRVACGAWLKLVYTQYLVVCPTRQVLPVLAEPHAVDCPGVVGQTRQLLRLRVRRIGGIQDGVR